MYNRNTLLFLLTNVSLINITYASNPASVDYVNQQIQILRNALQTEINNISSGRGFVTANASFTVTITERAAGGVTGQYSVFVIAPDESVQAGFTTSPPAVATNQSFTIGPPILLGPYYVVVHNVSLSASFSPATNVQIQDTFGHVDRFNTFYSIGPGSGGTLPDYTDQKFYYVPYRAAP